VTPRIEFGTKSAADEVRDEFSDYLCPDDDRRLKAVRLVSDAPESVVDAVETQALESREAETRSHTVELSQSQRDRISEVGGFDGLATTFNWRSAAGTFAREGVSDQFDDAIGSLADYDDPVEGAEEWIADARESDATQGTQTASGGARDAGEEDVQQAQRAAEASRTAQSEQCDHARGHCKSGEPEACEFLTDVCGYDESEAERLLSGSVTPQTPDDEGDDPPEQTQLVTVGGGDLPEMDVTPEQATALSRSWQGYKGAVGTLERGLDDLREEVRNGRQAMRAINSIREAHGQDPLHPNRLHDLLEALEKMPGSIPEIRTLDHFGDEPATDGDDDPDDSPEQFAAEKQGRLGVDLEAEENPGEKQVTLTGGDADDPSNQALPNDWERRGSNWDGGPYTVQLDKPGRDWVVKLTGPEGKFDVATGLRDATDAEAVAEDFVDRVDPDDISLHSSDSTVQQAAAAAKEAVENGGGLERFA